MKLITKAIVTKGNVELETVDSASIKPVSVGQIQDAEHSVKQIKLAACIQLLSGQKTGDLMEALAADFEAGKNSETIAMLPKTEWSETARHLFTAYCYREKHGAKALRDLYKSAMQHAKRTTSLVPYTLFALVKLDPDGTGKLPEAVTEDGATITDATQGKASDKTPKALQLWKQWVSLAEKHKDDPSALILEWDRVLMAAALDSAKDEKDVPASVIETA